jgi:hypothetical protein
MRYRMEAIEDELIIRNVETDIQLGTAVPFWMNDPNDPIHPIFGCSVLNKDADKIATISTITVPNPLEQAAAAVANYEEYYGYPGFKGGTKGTQPDRIERRLGTLLADAVSVGALGLIECQSGGLKAETKEKCSQLLAQICGIWYASRFGSFDGERRVIDPYFANFGDDSRMSFGAAAQHYGMIELRTRFPDESETTLKKVLSWPLDCGFRRSRPGITG